MANEAQADAALIIRGLVSGYGPSSVLHGVSLEVPRGSVVAIFGPNGAGKSTLLHTITGLVRARRGSIRVNGQEVTTMRPDQIARLGVGYLPQGRRLFPYLTAAGNIRIGAYPRPDRQQAKEDVEEFIHRWPVVENRRDRAAGLLSGGEQQVVGLGRALMGRPSVLLLDEPSLGLAPLLIKETYRQIRSIMEAGDLTVVIVEQNVARALELADHVYVMVSGEIVMSALASGTSSSQIAALYFAGAPNSDAKGGDPLGSSSSNS